MTTHYLLWMSPMEGNHIIQHASETECRQHAEQLLVVDPHCRAAVLTLDRDASEPVRVSHINDPPAETPSPSEPGEPGEQ